MSADDRELSDSLKGRVEAILEGEKRVADAETPERIESGKKATTLSVRRMYREGGEEGDEEDRSELIDVPLPEVDPRLMAHVTYGNSMTVNLGNYESCRVEIGITLPAYTEEIAEAYKLARKLVGDRMSSEMLDLKEYRKRRGT